MQHLPSYLQLAGLALAVVVAACIHLLLGVLALAAVLFTVGLALERR